MLTLDPNGAIFKAAVALGYSNPDAMSEGQLMRAVEAASGSLPPLPLSPFTQETDDFKARAVQDAADRSFAINLITKVSTAMAATYAAFLKVNTIRFNRIITNIHLIVPGPPDTASDIEYARLSTLSSNLFLYGEAVSPGWTGNIGLLGHETQETLLARLKSTYPDADAVVNS